ncbi:MAG: hypothetical protein AB1486_13590 [Planctomycetota bacterium]
MRELGRGRGWWRGRSRSVQGEEGTDREGELIHWLWVDRIARQLAAKGLDARKEAPLQFGHVADVLVKTETRLIVSFESPSSNWRPATKLKSQARCERHPLGGTEVKLEHLSEHHGTGKRRIAGNRDRHLQPICRNGN